MKPLPHNLIWCIVILAIWMTRITALAQNLIQNGSFERITECPTFEYGAICDGFAPHGNAARLATPNSIKVVLKEKVFTGDVTLLR